MTAEAARTGRIEDPALRALVQSALAVAEINATLAEVGVLPRPMGADLRRAELARRLGKAVDTGPLGDAGLWGAIHDAGILAAVAEADAVVSRSSADGGWRSQQADTA